MQIRVKCSCRHEECREWAVIEMQGIVESQPFVGEQIHNLEFGRLCCVSEGSYTFTIGYHELLGMKMPLKKPMLVLRKNKYGVQDMPNCADSSGVELQVIGIIRHRILFKSRPKALISRPPVKDKKTV